MTFAETNPIRLARLSEQSAHTEPYQLYRLLRHHEHNRDKHNKKKIEIELDIAGWLGCCIWRMRTMAIRQMPYIQIENEKYENTVVRCTLIEV